MIYLKRIKLIISLLHLQLPFDPLITRWRPLQQSAAESLFVCSLCSSTDLSWEHYGVHQLLSHLCQSAHPLQPESTRGVEVYPPKRGRCESLESLLKVSPWQTHTWKEQTLASPSWSRELKQQQQLFITFLVSRKSLRYPGGSVLSVQCWHARPAPAAVPGLEVCIPLSPWQQLPGQESLRSPQTGWTSWGSAGAGSLLSEPANEHTDRFTTNISLCICARVCMCVCVCWPGLLAWCVQSPGWSGPPAPQSMRGVGSARSGWSWPDTPGCRELPARPPGPANLQQTGRVGMNRHAMIISTVCCPAWQQFPHTKVKNVFITLCIVLLEQRLRSMLVFWRGCRRRHMIHVIK